MWRGVMYMWGGGTKYCLNKSGHSPAGLSHDPPPYIFNSPLTTYALFYVHFIILISLCHPAPISCLSCPISHIPLKFVQLMKIFGSKHLVLYNFLM